ncbi:hypothetical protein [Bacillus massiliigorillae]|uniref:hypothetical protein n=1 Tax=Bacillus massiliigorillae TaxID=1243664 RepID=UPI00039ECC1F|nr:hypothetical protein [Bacillus massiliigorillae]
MMNIYDALQGITLKKRLYFTWKHDIRFKRDIEKKSEEDFLKEVQLKTMDGFIKWEKTSEYKQLLMLLLDSKVSNDFEDIYNIVSKQAKEGDEKSIRLFITLQKEIQAYAKVASKQFDTTPSKHVNDESEEEDDLDLD